MGASAAAITRTSRTIGSVARHASVSRSPKCERTQSAMNWLGISNSRAPLSGSSVPSWAGFSQPSNVRAPRSRRRPVRIESQAASSGAASLLSASCRHESVPLPCTGLHLLRSPGFRQSESCRVRSESLAPSSLSVLPPARTRASEECFCEPTGQLSRHFFHKCEIKALDIENTRKPETLAENRQFFCAFTLR